jgi:uncharacterized integral membrane protein (TIGR00697 family)
MAAVSASTSSGPEDTVLHECSERLFSVMMAAFAVVLVLTNIIGVKLFLAFPDILPGGIFGEPVTLTTGLITYPLTFLITDIVCEVYGRKRADLMVMTGFAMSFLTLILIQIALFLPGAPAWPAGNPHYGNVNEMQTAFESVFTLPGVLIFASMTAYLAAQLLDVRLFHFWKRVTHGRHLWIRNNASTMVSQLVDTIIVNSIFLKWGLGLDWALVGKIIVASYICKVIMAAADTPLIYAGVALARRYGAEPLTVADYVGAVNHLVGHLTDPKAAPLLDRLLNGVFPLLGEHFDFALGLFNAVTAKRGHDEAVRRFKDYVAEYPVHPFGGREIGSGAPVALLLGAGDLDFMLEKGFAVPAGHAGMCDLIMHTDVPVKMVFVSPNMKLKETRAAIADCRMVVNAIADADQLPKSAQRAVQFCRSLKKPVINPPADILNNLRDKDAKRFEARDDILWPRTVRVAPENMSDKKIRDMFGRKGWEYPLTVRGVGAHGGVGLEKVDDADALIARLRQGDSPEYFVANWIDFKSEDGWYRKYRVYRIGGRIVPYHLYIDRSWKIHFGARETMAGHPEMIEEERAVIMRERADLEDIFERLLTAIWEETGLDYIGCDFSILPDGRPVVFEANACMKPNVGIAAAKFPSNAHAGEALVAAFKDMVTG